MPLLWRYMAFHYFRVFFLCIATFIGVLLVTRFQEIARFATLSAQASSTALFILYQIPLILPLAIPISCAIAAVILLMKMSRIHELTALRSCGLNLRQIIFPLILSGFLLSLFNFAIVAYVGPASRHNSRELIYKMTQINPLFLLHKDALVRIKHIHVDMSKIENGKRAEDVIFVSNNNSNGRLGIMSAKELSLEDGMLEGKGVSLISSWDGQEADWFDHLLIENQQKMCMKDSTLAPFMQNDEWQSGHEYLSIYDLVEKAKSENWASLFQGRSLFEISKRSTLALATFTFTIMGAAFGVDIGRGKKNRGVLFCGVLIILFLFCFLGARSMRHSALLASCINLLPHPFIILFSMIWLRRVNRGVET